MDTDILSPQRNTQVAIGFALQALAGQSTVLDGLILTPTSPASLTVNVGPGSIMSLGVIDATNYGSLVANLAPLVKQGINTTSTSFTLAAPLSSGQSTNYLIQAQVLESDQIPVVLPYYNASNPAQPYSGPANAGTSQNTQRNQRVQLQIKAGAPAPAGTQTTPAVDAGWIGLYVITVSFGQTQITSANLTNSLIQTAPFVDPQRLGRGVLPGRLMAVRKFLAAGTFTYTATPGTNTIVVEILGGGGGGGSAQNGSSTSAATAGGGGAGSYIKSLYSIATIGAVQTVIVGVGGAGGASGAQNGTPGGTSSFGALASAPGGALGQGCTAATTNKIAAASGFSSPPVGGNIINVYGTGGDYGIQFNPASNFYANSGAGGHSFYSAGGGGVGQDTTGFAGQLGSGGSGGCTGLTGSGFRGGGAGGDGLVLVWEYS